MPRPPSSPRKRLHEQKDPTPASPKLFVRQQLELRKAAAEQDSEHRATANRLAMAVQKLVDAAAEAEREHREQEAKPAARSESASQAAAKEKSCQR